MPRHPLRERKCNRASQLGLSQWVLLRAEKWTLNQVQGDVAFEGAYKFRETFPPQRCARLVSRKDTKAQSVRKKEQRILSPAVTLPPLRHPELVSGSIVQRHPLRERKCNRASQLGLSQWVLLRAEKWTLNQVQGDVG